MTKPPARARAPRSVYVRRRLIEWNRGKPRVHWDLNNRKLKLRSLASSSPSDSAPAGATPGYRGSTVRRFGSGLNPILRRRLYFQFGKADENPTFQLAPAEQVEVHL